MELNINWLAGMHPTQATGTLNGHAFYFRARGNFWAFYLTETPDRDPAAIDKREKGDYIFSETTRKNCGAMSLAEAVGCIGKAAGKYLAHKGVHLIGDTDSIWEGEMSTHSEDT